MPPALPYIIPGTTVQVCDVLPNTHISPETAYLIADYPYGFNLRCKMRYWLEFSPRHGIRLMSQTTNPKRADVFWNKPKGSTYCKFGGAMFLDQNGHVQWSGLSEYRTTAECIEWREIFGDGVPETARRITDAWIKVKVAHDEKKAPAAA